MKILIAVLGILALATQAQAQARCRTRTRAATAARAATASSGGLFADQREQRASRSRRSGRRNGWDGNPPGLQVRKSSSAATPIIWP